MTVADPPITPRRALAFWVPLAAMWLMMSFEQPLITSVIARLPEAEINLAAFGVNVSLALLVESPVIMLLTAGTALASGRRRYRRLMVFTTGLAVALGALHLWIAVSPAYAWFIGDLVGVPPEVVAPGRRAFLWLLPWTPAIAYRRLWQGVLIRHDRPGAASLPTVVRLVSLAAVCAVGLGAPFMAGASLGGLALSVGVTVSAVAAWAMVRPTVRAHLSGGGQDAPLTWAFLVDFYMPLALTSFILLGGQPILNFALGRSPDALSALAVWPVLTAVLFVFRSGGYAFQEVVVALSGRPGGREVLGRLAAGLALALSAGLACLALTPLAGLWFERIAGLPPHLAVLGRLPLALLVPAPGLSVLVSWLRGRLVHAGRTRSITTAVAVNVAVLVGAMGLGLALSGGRVPGASLAAVALTLSLVAEALALAAFARRTGA